MAVKPDRYIVVHGVRIKVRSSPPPAGTAGEDLQAVVDAVLRHCGIHPESTRP